MSAKGRKRTPETAEAPALQLGLRVRWRCKGANQNNAPGTPMTAESAVTLLEGYERT